MQFLYDSGDAAVFMDNQSYEQVEIPKSIVGDALRWVPPNSEVDLLFVDERATGASPPSAVDLAVTQTDPGLKGDTASGGGTKPATLETGVVIQVPLFIEEGEKPFTRERAEAVQTHQAELDELIARHSKGWALERIAPLERNIMRTALYEALHRDDIPVEVAIDEAIELSKEYCGADAPGFVNGILGAALAERGAV